MITTERYVRIDEGTPVTHKIETADGEAHVVIGAISGSGSAVALTFNDPDMFRRVVDTIMEARDQFTRFILERRTHPQRDDGTLTVVT